MGQKAESKDTNIVLANLQAIGWFRNITDTFQIGIPDILGCYKGRACGIEIKSIDEVPQNGWAPAKSKHRFTPKQVEELKSISRSGGISIACIICGPILMYGTPYDINKDGQINCTTLFTNGQYIQKCSGKWDFETLLNCFL